jgi:integrative and conjugative element protein (TIGR02256 family)
MSVAWIRADALDEVRRHARDRHPLETGGLLLGWTDDATGDAVVAAIVGPGPAAKHGRTSFLPDHDWQRAELARRYAGSGRVHVYLGDWHTHWPAPAPPPAPGTPPGTCSNGPSGPLPRALPPKIRVSTDAGQLQIPPQQPIPARLATHSYETTPGKHAPISLPSKRAGAAEALRRTPQAGQDLPAPRSPRTARKARQLGTAGHGRFRYRCLCSDNDRSHGGATRGC